MSEHLTKLQNLQTENAQLYARLAELKKMNCEERKMSGVEPDESEIEAELEETLKKNSKLQDELKQLKTQKDQLQAKCEQLSIEYHKVTLVKIKQEEEATHKFHDSLLEIISKHNDIDIKSLSNLILIAEEHRKRMVELKNEMDKISGFIKLQKYQNIEKAQQLPIPHHNHQNRSSLGMQLPIIVNGAPPSLPSRRRRVSFAKVGMNS